MATPPAKKIPKLTEWNIEDLSPRVKQKFVKYDKDFSALQKQVGKIMALALILFVPSVLLIFCGALCLTLPGAYVIQDTLYDILFPGISLMIISLFLFHRAYLPSQKKDSIRNEWINETIKILEENLNRPKNVTLKAFVTSGAKFVETNLIPPGNDIYQTFFIKKLKDRYKDTEVKKEKLIVQILDETHKNVIKPKKK